MGAVWSSLEQSGAVRCSQVQGPDTDAPYTPPAADAKSNSSFVPERGLATPLVWGKMIQEMKGIYVIQAAERL